MGERIIKSLCSINSLECGIRKEFNIVEMANGQRLYHIGTWKNDRKINGVYLTFSELQKLKEALEDKEKELVKEKANEKFQKDFVQQIHNGDVDIKKDKNL